MIIALKLLLAPTLIAVATLAGRRWGPAFSGWLIGFPFISAPISLILATQNGIDFAADAAIGTLAGQASVCLFSATYILASRKLKWYWSILLALGVFFGCTALWRTFPLPLLPTLGILVGLILLLYLLFPARPLAGAAPARPWWDLPARMLTAVIFVYLLTNLSGWLGSQLSGILSAFPVFGTILATFTHAGQGKDAVRQLLRGSIIGSFGIAGFYVMIGLVLPLTGSLWTYLLAALASVIANGLVLPLTRSKETISSPK